MLRLAKNRKKYKHFIAEGDKICQEILKNNPEAIHAIYCLPEWLDANYTDLQLLQSLITEITFQELKKISNLKTPNQVLLIVKQPTLVLDLSACTNNLTLLLDRIQDPGNMGTILRIADWFGIPRVICSPDCVDIYNPKVVQASMGAFLRVQTFIEDLPTFCKQFPKLPVYGAILNGANIHNTSLEPNAFIVIGNESRGISETLQNCLTHRIAIPCYGGAESLNAAVATGIICAFFRG